jgi:fatty acid desaturase
MYRSPGTRAGLVANAASRMQSTATSAYSARASSAAASEREPIPGADVKPSTITASIWYCPPPIVGICIFWASCVCVLGLFLVPTPWCWLCLLAIVPLIHGAHEVLHNSLLPRTGRLARGRRLHQRTAEAVGFALQGMNIELLRPAHLHHHRFGRHDEGYAPDVGAAKRPLYGTIRYYIALVGLPAAAWQAAGFARLLAPPRLLPFRVPIEFKATLTRRYVGDQVAVAGFFAYAVLAGGVGRLLLYEFTLCFIWSVQQNVAHYGLRGIDRDTDRVCSRTYLLPWPFSWVTFGSTSHFLHHADMGVPGRLLYERSALERAERELLVIVERQRGLRAYLLDLVRQFKGPVDEPELSTSWMVRSERASVVPVGASFGFRHGRTWPEPREGSLTASAGERVLADHSDA